MSASPPRGDGDNYLDASALLSRRHSRARSNSAGSSDGAGSPRGGGSGPAVPTITHKMRSGRRGSLASSDSSISPRALIYSPPDSPPLRPLKKVSFSQAGGGGGGGSASNTDDEGSSSRRSPHRGSRRNSSPMLGPRRLSDGEIVVPLELKRAVGSPVGSPHGSPQVSPRLSPRHASLRNVRAASVTVNAGQRASKTVPRPRSVTGGQLRHMRDVQDLEMMFAHNDARKWERSTLRAPVGGKASLKLRRSRSFNDVSDVVSALSTIAVPSSHGLAHGEHKGSDLRYQVLGARTRYIRVARKPDTPMRRNRSLGDLHEVEGIWDGIESRLQVSKRITDMEFDQFYRSLMFEMEKGSVEAEQREVMLRLSKLALRFINLTLFDMKRGKVKEVVEELAQMRNEWTLSGRNMVVKFLLSISRCSRLAELLHVQRAVTPGMDDSPNSPAPPAGTYIPILAGHATPLMSGRKARVYSRSVPRAHSRPHRSSHKKVAQVAASSVSPHGRGISPPRGRPRGVGVGVGIVKPVPSLPASPTGSSGTGTPPVPPSSSSSSAARVSGLAFELEKALELEKIKAREQRAEGAAAMTKATGDTAEQSPQQQQQQQREREVREGAERNIRRRLQFQRESSDDLLGSEGSGSLPPTPTVAGSPGTLPPKSKTKRNRGSGKHARGGGSTTSSAASSPRHGGGMPGVPPASPAASPGKDDKSSSGGGSGGGRVTRSRSGMLGWFKHPIRNFKLSLKNGSGGTDSPKIQSPRKDAKPNKDALDLAESISSITMLQCRICELGVPAVDWETHTKECAERQKNELAARRCDDRLRKIVVKLEEVIGSSRVVGDIESPKKKNTGILQSVKSIAVAAADLAYDERESLSRGVALISELRSALSGVDEVTAEYANRIEAIVREKITHLKKAQRSRVSLRRTSSDVALNVLMAAASRFSSAHNSVTSSPAESPAVSPRFESVTIKDFDLIKPISKGAYGVVYLGRKRRTGDVYAIKVLKKADMLRKNQVAHVLAERDILARVDNPFVVKLFYSFASKDNLYLVMEYLPGGDCFSMLRALGSLNEGTARHYIAEAVLALEYLHGQGIVHRDMKPDNMLIGMNGHIKLTDFGLSKTGLMDQTAAADDERYSAESSISSSLAGTSAGGACGGGVGGAGGAAARGVSVGTSFERGALQPQPQPTNLSPLSPPHKNTTGASSKYSNVFTPRRLDSLEEEHFFQGGDLDSELAAINQRAAGSPSKKDQANKLRSRSVASNMGAILGAMSMPHGALFGGRERSETLADRRKAYQKKDRPSCVGTPDYLAPEIILGVGHGKIVDWWAVGVILFEFLIGIPPFAAMTEVAIFEKIMEGRIPWQEVEDEGMAVSPDAKDLINRLLDSNPKTRLGANGSDEIKAHPFFRDIEWSMILHVKPPFVPKVKDQLDVKFFEPRHSAVSPVANERMLRDANSESVKSPDFVFDNFYYENLTNLAAANAVVHEDYLNSPQVSPRNRGSGVDAPEVLESVLQDHEASHIEEDGFVDSDDEHVEDSGAGLGFGADSDHDSVHTDDDNGIGMDSDMENELDHMSDCE